MNLARIRPAVLLVLPKTSSEDLFVMACIAVPGLIGAMMILAGVGLLKRRRWGRTLALGLGGFTGTMVLFVSAGMALELSHRTLSDADLRGFWFLVLWIVVYSGYCGVNYTVLLGKRNSIEFSRSAQVVTAVNHPQ
jgi:hypothetical protein